MRAPCSILRRILTRQTGAVELHSALSSLNEATFETAQVA